MPFVAQIIILASDASFNKRTDIVLHHATQRGLSKALLLRHVNESFPFSSVNVNRHGESVEPATFLFQKLDEFRPLE